MNKLSIKELEFLYNILNIEYHNMVNQNKDDFDDRFYNICMEKILQYHDNNKTCLKLLKEKHQQINYFNSNIRVINHNFNFNNFNSIDENELNYIVILEHKILIVDLLLINPGCYDKMNMNQIVDILQN
jgi:hypothetical protein